MDERIFRVDGLEDFIHELGLTRREVRRAERHFLDAASKAVVKHAKDYARQYGGVLVKSADEDLRTGRPGEVIYGGKPYSAGAEFGSYQYRQFERWRGNSANDNNAGYFLWPAIRRFRDKEMLDLWARELGEAFSTAFD